MSLRVAAGTGLENHNPLNVTLALTALLEANISHPTEVVHDLVEKSIQGRRAAGVWNKGV
jgi:hypothetical protein